MIMRLMCFIFGKLPVWKTRPASAIFSSGYGYDVSSTTE